MLKLRQTTDSKTPVLTASISESTTSAVPLVFWNETSFSEYSILLGPVTMGGLIQNSSSAVSLQSQKDHQQGSTAVTTGTDSKPKKKICCACPDTEKLRDECIVEHGESACEKWIEAHRKCLRAEGFNV